MGDKYRSATKNEMLKMLRYELHLHRHQRYWYHVKEAQSVEQTPLCKDLEKCIHIIRYKKVKVP